MLSNKLITDIVHRALEEVVNNEMSATQKQQLIAEVTKKLLAEELQEPKEDSFSKLVSEGRTISTEMSHTANLTLLPLKKCSVRYRSLLTSVFHFIEKNYRNPIGLQEVAKEVNLSPAYLTDLVRRETGKTVLTWIVEHRMAEARCLLIESDHSVTEIAQTLGYENPGHFIRLFRRFNGTTPKAWRICQIDNT